MGGFHVARYEPLFSLHVGEWLAARRHRGREATSAMMCVKRTDLPGIGIRYEFTSQMDEPVAVLAHESGRKELFVTDPADPDRFVSVLRLEERDARTLGDILTTSEAT
jgi:hypothetical protein